MNSRLNNRSKSILSICLILIVMAGLEALQLFYTASRPLIFCVILIVAILVIMYYMSDILNRYSKAELNAAFMEEQNNIILSHLRDVIFSNIFQINITKNKAYGDSAKKFCERLGFGEPMPTYDKILNFVSAHVIHKDHREIFLRSMSRKNIVGMYKAGTHYFDFETLIKFGADKYRWISIHSYLYFSETTQAIHSICFIKDIDDEKRELEMIKSKSEHDLLTKLLNKISTEETISSILNHLPEDSFYALAILDLDNFKSINDNLGHSIGDKVLRFVASYIKTTFRNSDIKGRIGGDEFLIFLFDIEKDVLEKKLTYLNQRVQLMRVLEPFPQKTSMSIGVVIDNRQHDFQDLYKEADKALYMAKSNGKACHVIIDNRPNEIKENTEAE